MKIWAWQCQSIKRKVPSKNIKISISISVLIISLYKGYIKPDSIQWGLDELKEIDRDREAAALADGLDGGSDGFVDIGDLDMNYDVASVATEGNSDLPLSNMLTFAGN